jgi:hypothetical protein
MVEVKAEMLVVYPEMICFGSIFPTLAIVSPRQPHQPYELVSPSVFQQ